MKLPILLLVFLPLILLSCEFKKSINKDIQTGLTTKGDGLSCEDVYLSDDEEKISRNSFIYGEKFYVNFSTIEGFQKQNGVVFPGMELFIMNKKGDTILQSNDVYKSYNEGITISPLLLKADISIAKPIFSEQKYILKINIWDKKGEGTYQAEMDFDIITNNNIKVETNHISYDEISLFSKEKNNTIIDNVARYNENLYMIFEGLKGFKEESGKVFPGLSLKATDANGEIVINEKDLIGETAMNASEFVVELAPSFIFTDPTIKSPITCKINIWDKKSDHWIKTMVKLDMLK